MNDIMKYGPALLPLIILELGLALFALLHLFRHPHVRKGNRILWVFLILFLQFLGPIAYMMIGREDA